MGSHKNGTPEPDPEGDPSAWDVHGAPDATLGGYAKEHDRPPAFEGSDGEPYTVDLEVEKTPDLSAPYEGYLVFPRWASTGLGVIGHVETPTLVRGSSRQAVLDELGDIPLLRAKRLLDEAISMRAEGPSGDSGGPSR